MTQNYGIFPPDEVLCSNHLFAEAEAFVWCNYTHESSMCTEGLGLGQSRARGEQTHGAAARGLGDAGLGCKVTSEPR